MKLSAEIKVQRDITKLISHYIQAIFVLNGYLGPQHKVKKFLLLQELLAINRLQNNCTDERNIIVMLGQ